MTIHGLGDEIGLVKNIEQLTSLINNHTKGALDSISSDLDSWDDAQKKQFCTQLGGVIETIYNGLSIITKYSDNLAHDINEHLEGNK